MYTLRLLLALLAGSLTSTPSTVTGPETDVLSCYTDEANAALLKQDPEYSRKSDSLDYAWSAAVKGGRSQEKSAFAPPYVLPIVFHIIHENGPENIPDADVQRSVDFLNQALANTDYYDPTTGANTQIQVCLAQRTPDNLPTNGIDRVVSPLTSLDVQDDLLLKNLSRWAPRDYINVWVVKEASGFGLGSGLAGYAYYPSAHGGRRDGIVMEARFLTRGEAAVGVLIHELGHYLGLRHTFNGGCQNDDCTRDGDAVCDTPPDQSTVAVPCGGSANSCDTDTNSGFATDQNDMHINYMDYGYFRCYSAFTAGQGDRMHFFLDGIRRSLTVSKGCLPPCPAVVTAGYTGGDVTVPVGTTLNFVNTSTNGASFRWVRGANLLSTATNYSQTFNSTGTYRIRLVADPADPTLCFSDSVEQVVRVVCPVVADISFPAADYETGAVITFTNTSTDGGSSSWSVNGTQVGTDPDLTYTFSALGRYQVCLRESSGLCSEERCRSLVVRAPPCDVRAAFIYNSVGFSVGGTVTFTNLSSGGTTHTWTIDGTQVGMDVNLTRTFPDLGSFEVCLREGNGICEREFCRIVEVPQEPCTGPDCPGNEGCSEGFTYLYGQPDGETTEEVTAVLPDGDRFFLSVSDGSRLWVVSVREDGSILWQTEVFPGGNVSLINEMILDDEGQLAAIGRTSLNQDNGDHSFMIRMDASTGNLLWARSYQFDLVRPLFNRVFSQQNTGNYTVIGYTENTNSVITVFDRDGLFLTIDKADGNIITGPLQYPNNGVLRFNTAAYDRDNGRYYVLGNIDGGATPNGVQNGTFLVTLDEAGTPLNSRLYNLGQVGSSFPVGIVQEGSELVFAITAASNPPASHTVFLLKSDLSGNVERATALPNLTGPPREMIASGQGYTLVGQDLFAPATNLFQTEVIQLNNDGTVNWARAILDQYHASSERITATPQMLHTHNNQIVLAGTYLSLQEGSIVKLDLLGNPVSDCHNVEPGEVTSELVEIPSSRLQLFAEPSQFFIDNFFSEPGGLVFNPEGCALDCPGVDTTGCLVPFFLQFSKNFVFPLQNVQQLTAVVERDDVYYVGGTTEQGFFIGAFTSEGQILWQKNTIGGSFDIGFVNNLGFDSDGNLIGSDVKAIFFSSVFRLDAQNGNIIWHREIENRYAYHITNIHERGTGGNFILTGRSPGTGSFTLIMDRNSGDIVREQLFYPPTSLFGYISSVYNNASSTLYTLSNVETDTGIKPVLSAIAENDDLLWAQELFSGFTDIDVTGLQLMIADDQLLVAARTTPALPGDSSIGLAARISSDGNIIDGSKVTFGGDFRLHQISYVRDDFAMIFQSVSTNEQAIYLPFLVDETMRSKIIRDRIALPDFTQSFVFANNQFVLCGQKASTDSPILESINIEGKRAESCDVSGLPNVEVNASPLNGISQIDLGLSGPGTPFGTTIVSRVKGFDISELLIYEPESSCPQDCELQEICNNQIDDDEDGLVDCDDPDLEGDCCCAALPTINLGPDTTLCQGDFLVEGTDRPFVSYRWSTGATTDSIAISLSGEYWLEVTDSCGNLASDTLTLRLRPRPLLDLGSDTTLCSNAIIPLLAQDGFASYEWVDGTTEKGFAGYGEGDFWVVATDSCGRVQTDTINVKIDPATEINLGADTLICLGDTLTFRLNGFSNYQWSESTFIDCTNCSVVRFAPTSDTLLLVAAEFGGGCFSSDSIRVSVLPIMGTRDSVYLCPGDSIIFGDTTLFTSGQYLDTRRNSLCEQTDTLDVFQLRDTLTLEVLSICQGDSVLVFDQFERIANNYQRSFSAANGCDSTHVIELIVRQPVVTSVTISVCTGDSTLIFGTFERTPGNYSRLFTAANQCDSVHVITLEINTLEVSAEQLQAVCGAAAGTGEVVFNQQADAVSIRWPDGTDQARNNNLVAGDYAITVTTLTEGCAAIANLTIETGLERDLSATATPETCPGENDGAIIITADELSGLSFSLNNGLVISTPQFTDLSPNNYTLLVIDSLGCDQEFILTVDVASEVLLNLPERITLPLGDSVTLRPQTNLPVGTFLLSWSSTLGDTCSNCPTLALRPSASTTVTATLTDSNGCSATDQTLISVSEEDLFYVPNAFSPNGDGVNDLFRLFPGPSVERILSFSVFDRWGGQVYHAEDLSPTGALAAWDGRSPNGQLPSIGVYVYHFELRLSNGKVVSQAGEVLLMR